MCVCWVERTSFLMMGFLVGRLWICSTSGFFSVVSIHTITHGNPLKYVRTICIYLHIIVKLSHSVFHEHFTGKLLCTESE